MQLWVYRDQRTRWWGRPRYRVTCKIGLDAEEGGVLLRHKLLRDLLFVSMAGAEYDARCESSLDLANAVEGHDTAAMTKRTALRRAAFAAYHAGQREVRVDVAAALIGHVIVAHDIVECMACENGVRAGFLALKAKCERLLAHERGDEELVHDGVQQTDAAGPEGWAGVRRIKI